MRASGWLLLALVASSALSLYATGVMTANPAPLKALSPAASATQMIQEQGVLHRRQPLLSAVNSYDLEAGSPREASETAMRFSLASVTATLASPAGLPVQGVVVVLRHGARVVARDRLDSSGSVQFDDLAPGRYSLEILTESLAAGFLPALCPASATTRWPFVLGRGARHELELPVHRSAALHGIVLDAAGVAVSGAAVRLQSTLRQVELPDPSTHSDELGRFAIVDLAPGTYRTQVRWPADSYVGAAPAPRVLTLREGDQASHVSLGEARPRSLRGRLVDEQGQGVEQVLVQCEMMSEASLETGHRLASEPVAPWSRILARTRTDEGGCFSLEGLPRVPVLLRVAPRFGAARGLRRTRPRHLEVLVGSFDLGLGEDPVEAGKIRIQAKP